jgi:transcriptional regulator with GAF, ATPase, and Fis domain
LSSDPRTKHDDVSTLLRPRFDPSPPASAFRLVVAHGPDAGAALEVDGSNPSRVLIGQGPACDLRLSDREVSRRHAALESDGARLRLMDLTSTNGTFVNGIAIVDCFLYGGESLRLGATTLHVELRGAADAASLPIAAGFGRVVGASTEMRRLYPLCERLAAADVPVIIEGETGTGKEVLAESLHERSPRAAGPFVVCDCTAIPPNLAESEIFGHERGAFTGAVGQRKGLFEQAHQGTLLIDEIGDLDPAIQPKLLRALERSEIRRVGGDKATHVDVRILSATRRDLDHEVAAGRFRDDLFHRLAVARVELPPLRRRRGDVGVLAQHFCEKLGAGSPIPDRVLKQWEDYGWPGNVRELRNAVARFLALGQLADAVPASKAEPDASARDYLDAVLNSKLPFVRARDQVLDEFRRRYVERALAEHNGNVAHAALASGIDRRYFQRIRARQR